MLMVTVPILGVLTISIGDYAVSAVPYVGILIFTTFVVLPAFLFRKWYAYRR